ncbi:MAG TPA: PIN domain-containing protein [Hydrogenobaculum sp.]|nr:PIN domain-containing protein [Hydrogenobaculum sp.]
MAEFFYSKSVLEYLIEASSTLYTSSDLITTIYYLMARENKNKSIALENISNLLEIIDVIIPFSHLEIKESIELMNKDSNFKDFEDTLQYYLAKSNNCDLILTNDNDFYSPDIYKLDAKTMFQNISNS